MDFQCVFAEALLAGGLGFTNSSFLMHKDFLEETCPAFGLPIRSMIDSSSLSQNRSLWVEEGMCGDGEHFPSPWNMTKAYTLYLQYCNARMCFVTRRKTLHHRLVEFVAALGGLYSIGMFVLVNLLWFCVQRTSSWKCGPSHADSKTLPNGGGCICGAAPMTKAVRKCKASLKGRLSGRFYRLPTRASRPVAQPLKADPCLSQPSSNQG